MINSKRNREIRAFIAEKLYPFYKTVGDKEFPFLAAVEICRRFKVYSPKTFDGDVLHSVRRHLRTLLADESRVKVLAKQEKYASKLFEACGIADEIKN